MCPGDTGIDTRFLRNGDSSSGGQVLQRRSTDDDGAIACTPGEILQKTVDGRGRSKDDYRTARRGCFRSVSSTDGAVDHLLFEFDTRFVQKSLAIKGYLFGAQVEKLLFPKKLCQISSKIFSVKFSRLIKHPATEFSYPLGRSRSNSDGGITFPPRIDRLSATHCLFGGEDQRIASLVVDPICNDFKRYHRQRDRPFFPFRRCEVNRPFHSLDSEEFPSQTYLTLPS